MPLPGQAIDLSLRPFAFHRQHPGLRAAQRRNQGDQLRQRRERARDHGVEITVLDGFHPPMQTFDIRQSQLARGMLHKADFLTVGINQRKASPRVQHCQWQTRKTGASASIGHGSSCEVRMNSDAVEQMMSQHRVPIANRRQIVCAVPALELIEQAQEAYSIRLGEIDSKSRGAVQEAFDCVQKRGSNETAAR